jgi:hypothetical protein
VVTENSPVHRDEHRHLCVRWNSSLPRQEQIALRSSTCFQVLHVSIERAELVALRRSLVGARRNSGTAAFAASCAGRRVDTDERASSKTRRDQPG